MNMTSLLGRIATNFEVKQVNDTSVTNFILAVDTTRKDKEGNGYETAFLPIVIFGKNAENTYKHVAKGDKVCVTGELRSRAYKKNGTDVMVIEVIAKYIEFVRRSKANQQQSQNQNQNGYNNQQQSQNQNIYNNQQQSINQSEYNNQQQQNQGGYYNQQQNQSGYNQPIQNQGGYQQPVNQGNYQQQPQYQNLSGFDDNFIPPIADGDIPF
ncbi:single-stranded DNA-binding protein [Clostridium sporogenes]|uniref:Single-stranded DNA-binding protein n=1 Tax=Clostridium sporogenes TaxID=1509 RepID=A0A7X5PEC4_CLOSG|nr:single-stranded DNA-binding protein [Clostridium sporogenes]AJD29107.1 single-stranded DNA-binding family protein [Clostridium botulinum Prevot_594]NFL98577.1 single-stranded DNA-binding protein [Clostridium botulinum]NFP56326.1 single-stranded DNA-binding protein [Clostridium botulinum]NFQ18547.1 single-stranded DNA-binding protein [Clostridium sporogenes]NFQ22472.1 single-stranded DNA-binding protein [Clostridium sporogenes]